MLSQVSMQCLVAVGLGTWGVLGLQGSFMPIRSTEVMGKQTIENLEPGTPPIGAVLSYVVRPCPPCARELHSR